ncbi:LysE family translocator [Streptomyces sp. IBSBF 2435]|uniref:LysE family translocator n=1 Tax=Streptomyces sp. IBSBF 2435 TaxID=2903531 RepID=UPI002FDBDA2A
MIAALTGFALFAMVVTVVPGPDTLLVLRNAVRGGLRAGSASAVGAGLGSMVWASAAAVGLDAALRRWDTAFTAVRVAGGLYLLVLGVQALWSVRPGRKDPVRAGQDGPVRAGEEDAAEPAPALAEGQVTGRQAFRQGLLSCVLNPKVGTFFIAVAPQFLPSGRSVLTATLLFGMVDASIAIVWLLVVAAGAARLMDRLRRPAVNLALEGTAGGALVVLGAVAAMEAART